MSENITLEFLKNYGLFIICIILFIFFTYKICYYIMLKFHQRKLNIIENYKNDLNFLKENPNDSDIRNKCFISGKKFYEYQNHKITLFELNSLIRSDIERTIGHLEFKKW